MPVDVSIHYDNHWSFADPHLWVWYDEPGRGPDDVAPDGHDGFGPVFRFQPAAVGFGFLFKDGPGASPARWEDDGLRRFHRVGPQRREIWCRGDRSFVYDVEPRRPETRSAAEFLATVTTVPGVYLPATDGLSGLGATVLAGGGVLFGLYQPNAARVHVCGTFNEWQHPGHDNPDPSRFHELALHRGYFGEPNLWLGLVPEAGPDDEYKYVVRGGVPHDQQGRSLRWCTDPFARLLGSNYSDNAVVVDPGRFSWTDGGFTIPDRADLVIYELSVHGFTEGDGDVDPAKWGRFAGITERIRDGYFTGLGITALSVMPLAETSTMQGSTSLGYNPMIFSTVERDFGTPDDLRELVDTAHAHGLAVLLDEVFNHTNNEPNPLWKAILERPEEEFDESEGGLYFNDRTDWGNRVATEKRDVQNLLIDVCKMFLREYHVDGFRFDATHTRNVNHDFMLRLADELTGFRPRVILVAENLPNEADLNRSGYDGFSQWADPFHDKMKALLREAVYQDHHFPTTDRLGDIFYFCRGEYAAHTNNVVNYVESHDETSVAYEVGTNPAIPIFAHDATKDRKGRLGLFATTVALGQPMIYMGQEFNVHRDRNRVDFTWPQGGPDSDGFYRWASRLLPMRRRYPALRIAGSAPADDGRFTWILGPWMDETHGRDRKVVGWRLRPNGFAHDAMVVLLNFETAPVRVDLELGLGGTWVKLADMDVANDVPPSGTNSAADPTALHSADGRFGGFELPSSSGFLYKWES